MADKSSRASLNLKSPMCTDSPLGADIFAFGDPEAKVLQNTGIERMGGVTNLYEKETTFATAGLHSLYTKSGDLLQVDASHNVRINDISIGNVGTYAVSLRGALRGYSDAAWTATNTIIGIVKVGSAIRVDEYNPVTGAVANTRSTTFTMPAVAITNVALVKYVGMAYADSLEFILSNSKASYLLRESGTTQAMIGGISFTTRTLTAKIWESVCWSPSLGIFCAVSYDGAASYYGTSSDGISWSTGALASGYWKSVCWSPSLSIFASVSSAGPNYAASSVDGSTWVARTLTAKAWNEVCWSPSLGIFCAVSADGASSYYGISTNGTSWSTGALASGNWTGVCWVAELGVFVAVSNTTNYAATSPDGSTWSVQTLAAKNWNSVCWSPQLGKLCAVSADGASSYWAVSTNGTAWTTGAMPSGIWETVAWSAELSLFVAISSSTNYAASSPDGTTWTLISLTASAWKGIAWSPTLQTFALVSGTGTPYAANSQLLINSSSFCWKFSASNYLIGAQGQSGKWFIGDVAGVPTAITDATWCVIDQFAGTAYSRAILTFNVKKNSANLLTGIGEVGYTQAGVYSATPVYYGVALAAVTVTITENVSGPGYAEATFTRSDTGTAIFYYLAPIMGHLPGLWYDYQQSQTHTLCNGYGRLTDFVGNSLGATCALRVVMLNGQPSMISAGVVGAENTLPMDCLGVPITNVGEFDEYFVPHVADNGSTRLNCIYRSAGVLFFFSITSGATNTLQRVSDNLYLVNCLSPVNVVNVAERTLALGTNDYNGRILFRSAAAIITTAKAVGIMQGRHANSIDTGDKLITQTFAVATNMVPAIELPSFVDRAVPDYGVNIYLDDTYSATYQTVNVTYVKGDLADTLYIADTRIPFAIGYPFTSPVMQTEIETIFTGVGRIGSTDVENDYLCYEIGNQVTGIFEAFLLFGQRYLFDGNQIYLALFSGAIYGGKEPICPAYGMDLIGTSPTLIYFYSSFDNSIYTFDGGRALTKLIRMNDVDTILQGVFNVRDNSLLLETTTTLIWVRDGVITENVKKATQTGLGIYDTRSGIILANNTLSWQYNFSATGMTSIVPLTWQSAYHGVLNNTLSIATTWVITLYSATRQTVALTLTCYSFDQGKTYTNTAPLITIKPADWDSQGFYRCRIQPKNQLALASSVKVSTPQKVAITDVSVEYTGDAFAVTAASRSR